jgi:uncharacterized protein
MKVLEIVAVGMLRGYQWFIRPILPMSCRYWPSCSHYAIEAVQRHGVLGGGGLAIWRLLRCNPWGGSGLDPVPERLSLRGRARRPGGGDRAAPSHDRI